MIQPSIPCPAGSPLAPICERLGAQMAHVHRQKERLWRLGTMLHGIPDLWKRTEAAMEEYKEWRVLDDAALALRQWPGELWDLGQAMIQFTEAGPLDPGAFAGACSALAEEYPPSYQDFLMGVTRSVPRELVLSTQFDEDDLAMVRRLPPPVATAVMELVIEYDPKAFLWSSLLPRVLAALRESEPLSEVRRAAESYFAGFCTRNPATEPRWRQDRSAKRIYVLGNIAAGLACEEFCRGGMDLSKGLCFSGYGGEVLREGLLPLARVLRHDSLWVAVGFVKKLSDESDLPRRQIAHRAIKAALVCDALPLSEAPMDAWEWGMDRGERWLDGYHARLEAPSGHTRAPALRPADRP